MEIPIFPYNTGGRKLPCQNQVNSSKRFDTILAYDRRTDGQTDRQTHDDSIYRAIASAVKIETAADKSHRASSDRRECCQLSSTDDHRQFITLGVHLCVQHIQSGSKTGPQTNRHNSVKS